MRMLAEESREGTLELLLTTTVVLGVLAAVSLTVPAGSSITNLWNGTLAELQTFVERYPNSALMPEVKARLRDAKCISQRSRANSSRPA